MKNLLYFLIILVVGSLFFCKSHLGDEILLQEIMKNRMADHNYSKYTQSKNGDTVKFQVPDKGFSLQGKYRQIADYTVMSLHETDNELDKYLTAIFAHEGGEWQPVFEKILEPGILDTIIDMNNDNVDEIILQNYESDNAGDESKLGLYAKNGFQKYVKIGDLPPNYYHSNSYNKSSSIVELQ